MFQVENISQSHGNLADASQQLKIRDAARCRLRDVLHFIGLILCQLVVTAACNARITLVIRLKLALESVTVIAVLLAFQRRGQGGSHP